MTREEQLDWLCRLRSEIYVYMPKEWLIPMNDALDMTIQALSQEPCDDAISRDAVEDALYEYSENNDANYNLIITEYIDTIPSVNPQYTGNEFFNFDAPIVKKSMEQDAISREDALKLIYDFKEKHTEDREKHPINYGTLLDLIRLIRELPSVTQKSGKWIPVSERLPKPYEQVLRTVKSFGWNSDFHVHVDIDAICPIDTDVLAWMPLPKPYELQESEEQTDAT